MSMTQQAKMYLTIGILIFVAILALFSGGSYLIKNYTRSDDTSTEETDDGTVVITYNEDTVSQITGGYSGAPTLVKSDDKVFYIPPEYCDGSYLRNFRVIGMNLSGIREKTAAEKAAETTTTSSTSASTSAVSTSSSSDTDAETETTTEEYSVNDYVGVVVLYAFQTTYREDYGDDYDFGYEPYDYNVESEVVDSMFEDMINGEADSSKYFSEEEDGLSLWDSVESKDADEFSVLSLVTDNRIDAVIEATENEDVVDDSEFKVATVVMEHEIGEDECKILYVDSGSARVKDLDNGEFNLVTNLTDDALTVCYNEKMYVYAFNEKNATYGEEEIYYYSISELFDSSTFKNSMAEANYCSVQYNTTGAIGLTYSTSTWWGYWLSKVATTTTTNDVTSPGYLSNLETAKEPKADIHKNFIDMEAYLNSALTNAYSSFRNSIYGFLSYKYSVSVLEFGDYEYELQDDNLTWVLKTTFKAKLSYTIWAVLFPYSYSHEFEGTVKIQIVPEFTYKTGYTYTIDDLLLTKYDSSSDNRKQYSMIMQLMVTPTSESTDLEEVEPIDDFNEYLTDVITKGDSESTPDGVSESEADSALGGDGDDEDEEDSEETVETAISAKYLTFNINLFQESGETTVDSTKILTITGANQLKEEIELAEEGFYDERDASIEAFQSETKSGPYVIPKSFTIDGLKEAENQIAKIVAAKIDLVAKQAELAAAEEALAAEEAKQAENAEKVNAIADELVSDGALEIKNTSSYGSMGYYAELEELFASMPSTVTMDTNDGSITIGMSQIDKSTLDTYLSNSLSYAEKYLKNVDGMSGSRITYKGTTLTASDKLDAFKVDLKSADEVCEKVEKEKTAFLSDIDTLNSFLSSVSSTNTNISSFSMDVSTINDVYSDMNELYKFIYNTTIAQNFSAKITKYRTDFLSNYSSLKSELSSAYSAANNLSVYFETSSSSSKTVLAYLTEMSSILMTIDTYTSDTIPAIEAQIAALQAVLDELIETYDETVFSVDLTWDGEEMTGAFISENYTSYQTIIDSIDAYIGAYSTVYQYDAYRDSADQVIANIETLNTDYDINRIIDNMYDSVNLGTTYTDYAEDVGYLKSNKNAFYFNISAALNAAASIYTAETEDTSDYVEEESNPNLKAIKDAVEDFYYNMADNVRDELTYNDILEHSVTIFEELYNSGSFSLIETVTDEGTVQVCDVDDSTVLEYICECLMDTYQVKDMQYTDEDGLTATITLAKSGESSGTMSSEDGSSETTTEAASETTTSAASSEGYIQNLYAVYNSREKMASYADNMYAIYKRIRGLAFNLFYGTGALDEAQIAALIGASSGTVSDDGSTLTTETGEDEDIENLDSDPTSDFNVGYVAAYKICRDMPDLISHVVSYYEAREDAADAIRKAQSGHLGVVLADNEYYEWLCYEKIKQAEYLYELLYEAAKYTDGTDERKAVIAEFNAKTDWLILDAIPVSDNLESILQIKTDEVKTTYKKVVWNTALIDTEVDDKLQSIVTDDAYQFFAMKSNFAIVVNSDRGFIVPMGAQADAVVEGVNTKIKSEMSDAGMTGSVDNVAYGYDDSSDYNILLFSSSDEGKWFMIAFKQTTATDSSGKTIISVDENNIIGYHGTFDRSYVTTSGDTTTEDAHFLEYDHSMVTGLDQLYSITIENGFIPFDINRILNGSGTIKPAVTFKSTDVDNPVTEFEDGSTGVEGAFYGAWNFTSNGSGYVALLGYKKEDMEVEEETESTTEGSEAYNMSAAAEADSDSETDGETEETTEAVQYREITDEDLYKAHIYIYEYETKASKTEDATEETTASAYSMVYGSLAERLSQMTGPYAELVTLPVTILETIQIPLLVLAYALLSLVCISAGVNYAKAEDDEQKEKAKQRIKWLILGVLIIHITIVCLYLALDQLEDWEENIAIETMTDKTYYNEDDD
ncbi:MAG: pilin [Clostridiales bacterium]|nr:pilin [Clostridiales bacterium]